MTGLALQKKQEKRKRLLQSAYSLFTKKGVSNTTISEICDKAKIAKGTFYLYFQDKDDILRSLTKQMSMHLLNMTYAKVEDTKASFIDKVIIMADTLLEIFQNDADLVSLMKKDFIWPITEKELLTTKDETMASIRKEIEEYASSTSMSEHQILIRLYALISMLCAVSYSSIIDGFPDTIDSLKPELFQMIRQTFLSS